MGIYPFVRRKYRYRSGQPLNPQLTYRHHNHQHYTNRFALYINHFDCLHPSGRFLSSSLLCRVPSTFVFFASQHIMDIFAIFLDSLDFAHHTILSACHTPNSQNSIQPLKPTEHQMIRLVSASRHATASSNRIPPTPLAARFAFFQQHHMLISHISFIIAFC